MKTLFKIIPIISFAAALVMIVPGCKGDKTAENGHGADVKKSADTAKIKVIVHDLVESDFEGWGTSGAERRGRAEAGVTALAEGARVSSIRPSRTLVKAGAARCYLDGEK